MSCKLSESSNFSLGSSWKHILTKLRTTISWLGKGHKQNPRKHTYDQVVNNCKAGDNFLQKLTWSGYIKTAQSLKYLANVDNNHLQIETEV